MFGYGRDEIIKAMDAAVNPNDINMIRDKLDGMNKEEEITIDEQFGQINPDAPETPTPDLYAQSSTRSYFSSSTEDLMSPSSKLSIDVNSETSNTVSLFAQVEWMKKPTIDNYRGAKAALAPTIEEGVDIGMTDVELPKESDKSAATGTDITVDPKIAKRAKQRNL